MSIEIAARADAPGRALQHAWSEVVGAGRAAEGLRAGWQEQLRASAEQCGFRYVRFHGLFHDDMFILRTDEEGRRYYTFQYVDDLFDRLLDAGVRPFVELGFSPGPLAREKATTFWWGAHGSPPVDTEAWQELITTTVQHWVDRYGADEVATWYFEVWNEPNLGPFFRGTRSEYFALYEATVQAVRAVHPGLRVGGPATSNFVPDGRFAGETEDLSQHAVVAKAEDLDALEWRPVWVEEFLSYCQERRLPVDFVSCHPYPTDWALDGHSTEPQQFTRGSDATVRDLALLQCLVRGSAYPDAEIHLTEWNSSPSSRDHTHDHVPAATFVVKTHLEAIGTTNSLAHWTFTDVFEEMGAGPGEFHGGFGMVTYGGVPKPVFHAYRLLNRLGDELLERAPGAVVTRHRQSGRISALAYHYPEEQKQAPQGSFGDRTEAERLERTGAPCQVRVEVEGLPPHARVTIERLGLGSGDVISAWKRMGAPDTPTRAQTQLLREAANTLEQREAAADTAGRFVLDEEVDAWSVVLVQQA